MKRMCVALALVFAMGGAAAAASQQGCESSGGQAAGCTPVTTTTTTTVSPTIRNDVSNTSLNLNSNRQAQGQEQSQGQSATGIGVGGEQSQSASSRATAGANSSNNGVTQGVVVNNNSHAPDSVKTVGEAPAMITTTTAACRVAVQASAGWLGGAFGFGTSVLDEGCDTREDARLLVNMGEREAAVLRLCAKPEMAAALGSKCPAAPKSEPLPSFYN